MCGVQLLALLLLALGRSSVAPRGVAAQDAPRILIDQPVRAVEYQLGRLTNDELTLVERKDDDVRYRPVYVALLTRKGVAAQFRDEALAALDKMDKASRSRVLLDALAKVPLDDQVTAEKLLGLLLAQPAETLRKERATFIDAIDAAVGPPLVLRGAYAALMLGDGKPDGAWQMPPRSTRVTSPTSCSACATFQTRTCELERFSSPRRSPRCSAQRKMPPREPAALDALGWTRPDAATFDLLAREVKPDADARPARGSHRVAPADS